MHQKGKYLNGIGLLALIPTTFLVSFYFKTPFLQVLSWDPACHALDGLKLYHSLITFSPLSFWNHLTNLTIWPPMPPFLMVPFYFFFSYDTAPVALTFTAYFLTLFLGWVFLRQTGLKAGQAFCCYLLYLCLVVSSRLLTHYGMLVMYEIPGAALTLVAIVSYLRAIDPTAQPAQRVQRYQWAALATLCLLLTKWNYGLQWLLTLLSVEIYSRSKNYFKECFLPLLKDLLNWRIKPGLQVLASIALSLVLLILITGGGKYRVLGISISATQIANPLLVLYLVLLIKFLLIWRKKASMLPFLPEHRVFFKWCLIPYALWMAYPISNRFWALLYHLKFANVQGSRLSWANTYLSYRFLVDGYFASPLIFWCFALLFLIGIYLAFRQKNLSLLAVFGFVLFGLLTSTYATSNRAARFFTNFMPCFYLCAAWACAQIVNQLKRPWLIALPIGLCLFFYSYVVKSFTDPDLISGEYRYGSVEAWQKLRTEIATRLDGDRRLMAIGFFDMPSIATLLEIELHRRFPKYAIWPKPEVVDGGYQTTPFEAVKRRIESRSLKWLFIFDKLTDPKDPYVEPTRKFLASQVILKEHQFELADFGYRVSLYQLLP